ncbi:acylneuraminate cytidylyltransferase family protein [Leptospira noguchii]|uniref:acylneuraminate cytidylyltransferase family protein n=1 Tax=Leptospira noguchii TaxID=28182 RepID=UPI001146D343|nr:acylneuraminate cytidylyltransferase family protein [Leptospira noguchii]TQE84033.1 acylneuraminate cytidylyltransferase family protein [Leptospira noguchii]UOG54006.1 acylneuraminate cytidylyltransferase family protein [Leptospira noguchii]
MNLAVIPARGGSKGLPGKNIKSLCGKPLIAWSIEAAMKAKKIDRIVVSTDSEEIAAIAKEWNCTVLKRSAELATDETKTIAVLGQISKEIPEAENFILLQPTSPIRDAGLIDECVDIYKKGNFSNLATGFWCKYQEFGKHNNMRRQDYKGFFYDDGNVYVLSKKLVSNGLWFGDNICRHVISRHQNFEIDDEVDFVILEALLNNYGSVRN